MRPREYPVRKRWITRSEWADRKEARALVSDRVREERLSVLLGEEEASRVRCALAEAERRRT